MEQVNERIRNEICHDAIEKISDDALKDIYSNSVSVINNRRIMADRMRLLGISDDKICDFLKDSIIFTNFLVSPGTKGNYRGSIFNSIVKQSICDMKLDATRFDIRFEKQSEHHKTPEIPDWTIIDRDIGKCIIGMNQVSMWGGGQQINRASKYLDDPRYNTNDCKLLCVICNDIEFKNPKNKTFRLVQKGFENNTLCYLKNLSNIIHDFFQI